MISEVEYVFQAWQHRYGQKVPELWDVERQSNEGVLEMRDRIANGA